MFYKKESVFGIGQCVYICYYFSIIIPSNLNIRTNAEVLLLVTAQIVVIIMFVLQDYSKGVITVFIISTQQKCDVGCFLTLLFSYYYFSITPLLSSNVHDVPLSCFISFTF